MHVIYYLKNIGILKWLNGLQKTKVIFFIQYWLLWEKISTINVLQIFSYALDVCKFLGIAGKYYRWLSGDQYFFKEFISHYVRVLYAYCISIFYYFFAGLYVFVTYMHLFKSTSVLVVLKSIWNKMLYIQM